MIYLSASSLADYLICSQRYKFRIYDSEHSERSLGDSRQNIGIAVHRILELSWKKRDNNLISSVINDLEIKEPNSVKMINICLNNFYKNVSQLLNNDDLKEHSFKIKYKPNIYIVGRMDRITTDGNIFDWKTSPKIPETIDNDIQFILYHWAYKKMFNREPKNVFYSAILRNKLIKFSPNTKYYSELIDNILPKVINEIENKNFYKEGIFKGNVCDSCAFRKICLEEGRT